MITPIARIDALDLIQEDHLDLHQRIRAVRQKLNAQEVDPRSLWSELRALELELEEHFFHEEAEGFFDSLLDSAPHFAEPIAALKREHERFLAEIVAMKDRCNAPPFDCEQLAELSRLYQSFLAEFDGHEHAELKLVQETVNRDLGSAG